MACRCTSAGAREQPHRRRRSHDCNGRNAGGLAALAPARPGHVDPWIKISVPLRGSPRQLPNAERRRCPPDRCIRVGPPPALPAPLTQPSETSPCPDDHVATLPRETPAVVLTIVKPGATNHIGHMTVGSPEPQWPRAPLSVPTTEAAAIIGSGGGDGMLRMSIRPDTPARPRGAGPVARPVDDPIPSRPRPPCPSPRAMKKSSRVARRMSPLVAV
jgi:hypothetical protein